MSAPPKPAPPPPKTARPPQAAPQQQQRERKAPVISRGVMVGAQKIVIFGSGGAGKSSLAAAIDQLGSKPLFLDTDSGSGRLKVDRISPIDHFDDLIGFLRDDSLCEHYGAIVIDAMTRAEELAKGWVIENIKHEKGHYVSKIDDYGFGKGVEHIYDTMLTLIAELDRHIRSGRHVICICHECVTTVPNPAGEDWIRYEPRLQSPASGKNSVRHRIKEWADHLVFIGFDTAVKEDGKAVGAGTRTIYTTELPCWWAKSRSLSAPIPYEKDSAEFWQQLLNKDS